MDHAIVLPVVSTITPYVPLRILALLLLAGVEEWGLGLRAD